MLRQRARQLRKTMTEAEQALWAKLRRRQVHGHKFRRQHPLGGYIVDFVCLDKKLVVEVDGGQHDEQHDEDVRRTRWLEQRGFQVMRFWNHQVLTELDAVIRGFCGTWFAMVRDDRRGSKPPHPPRLRRVDLPPRGEV